MIPYGDDVSQVRQRRMAPAVFRPVPLVSLLAVLMLLLPVIGACRESPASSPTVVVTPRPQTATPAPVATPRTQATTRAPVTPSPAPKTQITRAPATPEPAAKPVTMTMGLISDLTGPTASGSMGDNWGIEDYFKWANETGYVPGVKFETVFYDNRFDVGRSINGYELMKTRKVQAVWIQMTGAAYALVPKAAGDKIVVFVPGPPKVLSPTSWAFSAEASYADGAGAAFEWMIEDWKKQGKPGKPKMASLNWDADYGYSGMIVNWYAAEKGIDVLPNELFASPAPTDVAAQLLRIKERGADYVTSVGPGAAWVRILKDATRLGLKDRIKFVGTANAIESESYINLDKAAFEGSYFVHFFASLHEENVPGVQWAKDMQVKYRGESLNWMRNEVGFMTGRMFVEGVKAAIEKDRIAPDKIDGDVIYQSLEKNIKNLDTGGLTGPLTISPENHAAANMAKVFQIRQGKQLPVTGWTRAPHLTRFVDVKK